MSRTAFAVIVSSVALAADASAVVAVARSPCCACQAEAVPGQAVVTANLPLLLHLYQPGRLDFSPPGVDPDRATLLELVSTLAEIQELLFVEPAGFRVDAALSAAGIATIEESFPSRLVAGEPAAVQEIVSDAVQAYLLQYSSFQALDAASRRDLAQTLVTVEPNFRLVAAAAGSAAVAGAACPNSPNDPLLCSQWALERTHVLDAWNHGSTGSSQVAVAVIDSGRDPAQSDLPEPSFQARFCSDDPAACRAPLSAVDESGHGTAVAGVIGALTNNERRVAGVNWEVTLLNLRVLDRHDRGTVFDGARALVTASRKGAHVASIAWGSRCPSIALWVAIGVARYYGVLVVTGAGNEQLDLDRDPASNPAFFPASFRHEHFRCPYWPFVGCSLPLPLLDNLLVVGATDLTRDPPGSEKDRRASFSGYGSEVVQIGAPGVGITSTGLEATTGGVADPSGTSMAAALVAGAAALVAAELTSSPPDRFRYRLIRDRLLEGADFCPQLTRCFERGRLLNVYNAIRGQQGSEGPACAPSPCAP